MHEVVPTLSAGSRASAHAQRPATLPASPPACPITDRTDQELTINQSINYANMQNFNGKIIKDLHTVANSESEEKPETSNKENDL